MGCDGSIPQRTNQSDVPETLSQQKLSEQIKQLVIDTIQIDNLAQAAVLGQENNIDANVQLSDEGLYWMATHFCCRWQAPKILEYILKQYYVYSPQSYIKFVNSRTSDGYTVLHLCAIWGSDKCLALLLQYGGLDLQAKDKMNKDPLQTAKDFKRQKMVNVLQKYQKANIGFTHVDHTKLVSGSILNLHEQRTYQMPMSDPIANLITNILNYSEEQNKIKQKKLRVEQEKQEICQRRLKQEAEMHKMKKELQEDQKAEQVVELMKIFEEKDKKYQHEIQKRYQEINIMNELLKRIQQQRLRKKIQQENLLITQNNVSDHPQNQKRISQKKTQINAIYLLVKGTLEIKKQKIKKNDSNARVQEDIKRRQNMKNQIFGICPQKFKKLYEQAKQKGIFSDEQFPALEESIGSTTGKKAAKARNLLSNLIWLRPTQFLKGGDYELFDGIDPHDIKQGSLGVCYMLATISVLAKNPETIRKIFHFYDKALGFYVLRLYRDGFQHFLVVDDMIPCSKSMKSPLFTKPIGNQIWVLLLEKAWAKSIGSYLDAQAMTPDHMMEDLSGSPSYGQWLTKDPQQKIQEINMHDDLNHIIVLTSVAEKKIEGIANNHAYSMLKSHQYKGSRIYQIRNPWGRFQWKGMYSQKQAIWTQQLKQKVGYKDGDDGLFYCSQDQLLQCFCYFSVSMIKPSFKYNFLPIKSGKSEVRYFSFEVAQQIQLNLRVTQKFKRMIQDEKYEYSPLVFETGKIEEDGTVIMLDQGHRKCYWGAKSCHSNDKIIRKFRKGKYFLRISMQWKFPEKYNQAVIVSYGQNDVKLTKLNENEGKQLWARMMINKGKQISKKKSGKIMYGLTWMKQHLLFYVQTQSQQPVQAKFVFNLEQLKNTKVGYNAIDQKTLQIEVSRGKPNIGTINKIDMSQGASAGSFNIYT